MIYMLNDDTNCDQISKIWDYCLLLTVISFYGHRNSYNRFRLMWGCNNVPGACVTKESPGLCPAYYVPIPRPSVYRQVPRGTRPVPGYEQDYSFRRISQSVFSQTQIKCKINYIIFKNLLWLMFVQFIRGNSK